MTGFRLFFAGACAWLASTMAFGQSTHYYVTAFGAQTSEDLARSSHTFATFAQVTDGALVGEWTISWLPAPGNFGAGDTMPLLRIVPGHNYTLDETIALSPGRSVRTWGPWEISPDFFARAMARVQYLNAALTDYKMMAPLQPGLRDAALHNQPGGAINCIMAVSDVEGYLNTGTAWGFDASQQVVNAMVPDVLDDLSTGPAAVHQDVAAMLNLAQRVPSGF